MERSSAGLPELLDGRYRLQRLLGSGGMADVYAATDQQTGAAVAVKVFRDHLPPGARRRSA